jgi:hypothetical protein
MGKLFAISLLVVFVLAVVPPKLELDVPSALFCFTNGLVIRMNGVLGLPTLASFDPCEPAGLVKLRKLRAVGARHPSPLVSLTSLL